MKAFTAFGLISRCFSVLKMMFKPIKSVTTFNEQLRSAHGWRNLFQSKGNKWSSKFYRKSLWFIWQMWHHKHRNV